MAGGSIPDPIQLSGQFNFSAGGSATEDPFARHLLMTLHSVWTSLLPVLVKLGVSGDADTPSPQQAYQECGERLDQWTANYQRLRRWFESDPAPDSAPWTWLGLATLRFSAKSAGSVFPKVPARVQKAVGVSLLAADGDVRLELASVVFQSVRMAREDLKGRRERPLSESDLAAAKYIKANPGCLGKHVAAAIHVFEEHYRSRIVPRLKEKCGLTSTRGGDGY